MHVYIIKLCGMAFLSLVLSVSHVNFLSLSATCLSSLLPFLIYSFSSLTLSLSSFIKLIPLLSPSLFYIILLLLLFLFLLLLCVCVFVGTMPVANRPIKLLLYSQFLSYSHSNHTHTHTHTKPQFTH